MGKTIAQKIFDAHRVDSPTDAMVVIRLDAVFCHEITTPIESMIWWRVERIACMILQK